MQHWILLSLPLLSWAARTTPNDPFRGISKHIVRAAEEPVCCLVPLDDPAETQGDDVLLPFEQWKEKQSAEQSKSKEPHNRSATATKKAGAAEPGEESSSQPPQPEDGALEVPEILPHFQVPLKDRFNYAAMDCSARVHLSHRSAKSASSILSSKKDRYMLSPCNTKESQFIEVELCDDIRIDTVQLANFEFFSGVFKDLTVSVAKTYTEGWTVVGTYTAKNIRGVQSFHPPRSIQDFYRYIRIEFHTHYGNEYYCPISLFRVYGLTHLEQWKWDIWESDYKAKLDALSSARSQETPDLATFTPIIAPTVDSSLFEQEHGTLTATMLATESVPLPGEDTSDDNESRNRHSTEIYRDGISSGASSNPTPDSAPPSDSDHKATATLEPTVIPAETVAPVTRVVTPVPPPPPPTTGGESIYRTIMNRLTALEGNHTLYVRYLEEQMTGAKELIRRLSEDVGRNQAQAQVYQRKIKEWEKQNRRIEMQYRELYYRVEHLSEEIVMEKRLSIAQLCLLLTVLVFMGLTRGSRQEVRKGMREWGRRHLSFSGDWFRKDAMAATQPLRRSPKQPVGFRMPDPTRTPRTEGDGGIVFPSSSLRSAPIGGSMQHVQSPLVPVPATASMILDTPTKEKPALKLDLPRPRKSSSSSRSRSHTPLRTARPPVSVVKHRAGPPVLKRANSGGHIVVNRSVKRWARTAHLHEVAQVKHEEEENENEEDDPFGLPRKYAAEKDPWLQKRWTDGLDGSEADWADTDGGESAADSVETDQEEEQETEQR
ncbi:hypothetical protein CYLTODRAFT_388407 [Cylindrobasidium torrendii FP15055 ss-10]|uniref:SUN domain-containing protein n=1 Tax=Cylindrobasidium torrendii FP15055 ss-10 TaxID=1314674 RepID=A0A0D7BPV5_9AGAR|nr:hypothetical protein CYLTODRAFT_388407 [Cylindrobasidium torrendii FP15055 ss-10]